MQNLLINLTNQELWVQVWVLDFFMLFCFQTKKLISWPSVHSSCILSWQPLYPSTCWLISHMSQLWGQAQPDSAQYQLSQQKLPARLEPLTSDFQSFSLPHELYGDYISWRYSHTIEYGRMYVLHVQILEKLLICTTLECFNISQGYLR